MEASKKRHLGVLRIVLGVVLLATMLPPLSPAAPAEAASTISVGNIVVNGSFEAPAIAPGTFSHLSSIDGWSRSTSFLFEVQNNRPGIGPAQDGAQLVELDSNGPSAIYQDLATTPGQVYQLSFWFSPRPGTAPGNNAVEVKWGGATVDQVTATVVGTTTTWEHHAYTVVAPGATTRLELLDRGSPVGDTFGTLIDNVRVTPVNDT